MLATKATHLLQRWIQKRIPADQYDWLQTRLTLNSRENNDRDLHISFGLIPRKLGRKDLNLTNDELVAAEQAVTGWNPHNWSVDTAARILLLCIVAEKTNQPFGLLFKKLCQTADLGESIALYHGLALYPASDELDTQIGEGLRTNMRAVFESIAHHNPYPQQNFNELRWNHMVLKALFIDSTLHPIQGLDKRANAELARILCDYAHERWAADRFVTPELWRCVGPFAQNESLDDLNKVLSTGGVLEQEAAALALTSCPESKAIIMLETRPDLQTAIANGALTWDSIANKLP